MTRLRAAAILVVASVGSVLGPAPVQAQGASDLAGQWTLNRDASQFPREIGFSPDWLGTGGPGVDAPASGGRGRRGTSSRPAGAFAPRLESPDDAKRLQQLTAEVRTPFTHLAIVDTPAAVTIASSPGHSRTFHPTGKEESIELDGVPVAAITKRDAGRLIVLYKVEEGRDLRFTYSRTASPSQLVVEVQFVEQRSVGDVVRRVYEPTSATETEATASAASPSAPAKPGGVVPAAGGPDYAQRGMPASGRSAAETFSQRPDAELKGLVNLGVVVEDLTPQAAACGLNRSTLETAVTKRLTDAGFKVQSNSDEDTYIYVNIITTSASAGLCFSRYDVFLYTHTTAKLSYQETPVLVQASLLHKGGLAGGGAAAHAEGVLRSVQEYVDQFSTRIHDANK